MTDQHVFEQLLQAVEATFKQRHPECETPIRQWKGQDIVLFQEELLEQTRGRISEKWFYTHIRKQGDKLPREDMLNLLAQYAGAESWRAFRHAQKEAEADAQPAAPAEDSATAARNKRIGMWIAVVATLTLLVNLLQPEKPRTYEVCFVDAFTNTAILLGDITLEVQRTNESPLLQTADSLGCVALQHEARELRYQVSAPYYKPKTIVRTLKKGKTSETVALQPDDYALIMHYYSTSDVKNWNARRARLFEIIAPNAQIWRLDAATGQPLQLYEQQEFVNRLTMPLRSLKNIRILHMEYENEQVITMRFTTDQPVS